MKKLAVILLCLCLTGCTYLGRTDAIRISSPADLAISKIETFGETPVTTPDESSDVGETATTDAPDTPAVVDHLILSLNTKKIHYFEECSYAKKIKAENRKTVSTQDEELLLTEGYTVCSYCAKHRG